MTEIAFRFDHRDKKGCACYRPIDHGPVHGDPARGPSLLVNRAFVSEHSLILGNVSAGRAGAGE